MDVVDRLRCRLSPPHATHPSDSYTLIMALGGTPLTPASQYITLMSSACRDNYPKNDASKFQTNFDPPLELRGGEFDVALVDVFHPTAWSNITDKFYIILTRAEKHRNYTPLHNRAMGDAPANDDNEPMSDAVSEFSDPNYLKSALHDHFRSKDKSDSKKRRSRDRKHPRKHRKKTSRRDSKKKNN